jgi:hypothetical protein
MSGRQVRRFCAPPPEAPVNVSVIAPSGAVLHNVLEVHAVIGPAGTPANGMPLTMAIICAAGPEPEGDPPA